ncbi:aromatic amino acid transporter [Aliivibrio sp. S4TY2]|uniref:aromatic amino acid transport family protein n=1 Tax=unclassified Aliivibrio TaxID=2645654 RepID=UPI002377F90D|nr:MULTISPECIES: aromatic amino acid transport family protein [unclassified Aliivibrio]MDD9156952.1 aromatic amino acid transporter [Aliivibrio sp. S4TY2]MDD9160834.1 aromatic amino acid transporter [Aliivibrio sp. S4TY1]MDD9164863.1 aromatic amino acid transporter [Aliivibrio sp. S4MY2]MDD9168862.1 aromatic amino acid transporter [Aliivibrio sp. S4MY4]MDD9185390.1 aromatic amino acid transporter [Aliivibrio sp. S4MY3]
MKTKVLGSSLIIAGTTIGAGMLALPLVSASLGFFTASVLMVGIWAIMSYTSLLMLEVHQHGHQSATLHSLALQFLGKNGQRIATFSMLFLFYALCAAYIAGGSEQFHEKINLVSPFQLPKTFSTILFTIIVAVIIALGTKTVDVINRGLFALKLIMLVSILFFLTPNITGEYLMSLPVHQGVFITALPVIFTSFGFHGSIPAIVNYLDLDIKKIKISLLIGSSLPLIIYLFWQGITLGQLSQSEFEQINGLNQFITTIQQSIDHQFIQIALSLFADLALLTSFIGVSLGLFEFLRDSSKKWQKSSIITAVLTYTPPLMFALFYPQGFITALGYAAIALVILALFLPVALVFSARKIHNNAEYTVAGGNIALTLVVLFGLTIIGSQVLSSF